MHIGAKKPQTIKGVTRQPAPGVGVVVQREDASCSYVLQIEGTLMRLGLWWLEAAARGGPQSLPLVNVSPLYEGDAPQGLSDAQPAAAPRGAARGPAAAKAALRAPSKAAGKAVAAPPAAAPAAAAPSSKAKAKGKAKASGLLLDGAEAMEARLLGADAAAASRKAKTAAVRAMNDLMSEYAALGG